MATRHAASIYASAARSETNNMQRNDVGCNVFTREPIEFIARGARGATAAMPCDMGLVFRPARSAVHDWFLMKVTPVARNAVLRSRHAQIGLAALALLAQYGVLMILSAHAYESRHLIIGTLAGCLIATVLGVLLIRGVSQYPGVEASAYIGPVFSLSYTVLLLAFILGRLQYSRILLISSFFVNMLLFFLIYSRHDRSDNLKIGIVPMGNYQSLLDASGATWQIIEAPDVSVDHLDAVAVDLRSDLPDAWERRLAEFALQNLPVYHSKHLLESLTGQVELEHLSENSFGTLSPLHAYMSFKHVADWLAAVIGLVVLSPILLIIAVVVRLDSPGPILFRQIRIGYQGRPFKVFKFRTMTVALQQAGDAALEAAKTKEGDRRITRPGAFLRQSRLDELPQLLNVAKGEMSWIGPRPEAEILSRWYEDEIPFYPYRHIVRPGITGWAQVNQGHVAEVAEVKSKLYYDFYYIRHFSPWIDLLIVARTIRTMLTGFGAR